MSRSQVLRIADPEIKQAYEMLLKIAWQKKGELIVENPSDRLLAGELNPYCITALEKIGVMRRGLTLDDWVIVPGVRFEVIAPRLGNDGEGGREVDEVTEKELQVKAVERKTAQAYYTLRQQAFKDGARGMVVVYPVEILTEEGFQLGLVEKLVAKGLLAKPEGEGEIEWLLKEAAVVVADSIVDVKTKTAVESQLTPPTAEKPTVTTEPIRAQESQVVGKLQEVVEVADEQVSAAGGKTIERAYQSLMAAADKNGQVVGASAVLAEAGFVGYTTALKERGLIAPVVDEHGEKVRVGKAIVWQVQVKEAEVERLSQPEAEEKVAESESKPAKPRPKKLKPKKAEPVARKTIEAAKSPPVALAKALAKKVVAQPKTVDRKDEVELLKTLIFNGEGTLKPSKQLQSVAAWLTAVAQLPKTTIQQWATAVKAAADNPALFELFLKLAKNKR